MGLLDKIKTDLQSNLTVSNSRPLIPPNTGELKQEYLPIIDAVNDEDYLVQDEEVNNALFPFNDREELKDKATELRLFFETFVMPEKKTVFGNGTQISNPKEFIQSAIKLMVTYWHDQVYVKDRICDLMFLKQCFEQNKIK
jgi:putative transposon-encoded protein